MLSALFDEEDAISGRMEGVERDGGVFPKSPSKRIPLPPSPRHSSGICGIANQGATCYLNSLLQTLLFTTEFRERLFQLGPDQLGFLLENNGSPQARVIPLQLQRLFARLLFLDTESASTVELTDSFGWTNNEMLQQHDVQELNRILFQAIESSLVGTAGHTLVKDLYNGRIVNQITCMECGRVSEREEDFLDMNVTVSGNDSLEEALQTMFVETEKMDGNNRYQCASCKSLTDATKGMKIRSLPHIFTVSLLRFSYDLVKFERFKETRKFAFPVELDLAPYCDGVHGPEETEYELFSVVIHKGSCYGGHYHCYIHDSDGVGKWTRPEEEKIALPTVTTGKVDYLAFDDPADIISALLVQTPTNSMPLDTLCAEMTRVTGISWNKRFKKSFGNITKFLRSNNHAFHFNDTNKYVTLLKINQQRFNTGHIGWDSPLEVAVGRQGDIPDQDPDSCEIVKPYDSGGERTGSQEKISSGNDQELSLSQPSKEKPSVVEPAHWFNLDDSRVKSVHESDLQNQFSGKESAYMLFYRRKSSVKDRSSSLYDLPAWLLDEVTKENSQLGLERSEYENEINRVSVELLFSSDFEYNNGAIQGLSSTSAEESKSDKNSLALHTVTKIKTTQLILDRRKRISDLMTAIEEVGGASVGNPVVVNLVREFPAGLQFLSNLVSLASSSSSSSSSPDVTLSTLPGLVDGALLFVWNGTEVNGVVVPKDAFVEPVLLNIHCQRLQADGIPYQDTYVHSFPKSMTLAEFRLQLPSIINSSEPEVPDEVSSFIKVLPPSCTIARVRSSKDSAADTRHIAQGFETFVFDSQYEDSTFIELGLVDFDTILVDLTGFSMDAPADKTKQTWASIANKSGVEPPEIAPVNVSTAAAPTEETPEPAPKLPLLADLPLLAGKEEISPLLCILAKIQISTYTNPTADLHTIQVKVKPTMSVGKLKYVIIDALKQNANDLTDVNNGDDTTEVQQSDFNGKFLRLRILEESWGPRPPLYEKMSLEEAGFKDGMTVILEDGNAPKLNQITLSFTCSTGMADSEIIIEKDATISDCISRMVGMISLSEGTAVDGWHLRKTNWEGEGVEAMEDATLSLDQEGIKDGDHVLLEEGIVPPRGFLRLPVSLLGECSQMSPNAEIDLSEKNKADLIEHREGSPSLKLLQTKIFVGYLEFTQDTTLYSLKNEIIKLLDVKGLARKDTVRWPSLENKTPMHIRVATVDAKGIQGSVLKGHKATLKVLHVTNTAQLLVTVLDDAEDPSPTQVILRSYVRLPDTKSYESMGEVLWETAGAGATAASLRTAIAKALKLPSSELVLAKYFPNKYDWLILSDAKQPTSIKKQYGKPLTKKGAKGGLCKKNLKQSPYFIQDGDTIGIKTLTSDPLHEDNFLTEYDERGKKKLLEWEEEKRRKRQENRQRQNSDSQNVIGGGGSERRQGEKKTRVEVPLTIHVPKYE